MRVRISPNENAPRRIFLERRGFRGRNSAVRFRAGLGVVLHLREGAREAWARANGPGFSFIPELIYGGRRISGAASRGPRKWSASPVSLSHVLLRIVLLARRALAHVSVSARGSYDLGSNFCPSRLSSSHAEDALFFLRSPFFFFFFISPLESVHRLDI